MPIHEHWVIAAAGTDVPIPVAHAALRGILARRGIVNADSFRRFVSPTLEDLHDPSTIHGMAEACERIERAIRDRETILIYGDYDVDGVTSIVLLQKVLRLLGGDAEFVIPHRLIDGYGLKIEVLERVLAEKDVKLVITVDCGISSIEPVRLAIERGIDVIITDHHLPPGNLPSAAAVLNPKQAGCVYPFKELAGVGVAFKLCCELIRRSGRKVSTASLLKIAAIGTIADVAPLIGENRTIAQLGLSGLGDVRNPGLRALLRRVGLEGKAVRSSDVGFKIGPRINAAGRLASANTAIDLFHAADESAAWGICSELDRMNAERQQIEVQVRGAAEEQVAGGERILVLAGEGWHRGVVGLTAGRIAQKHYRPTLVIARDGERCVGSGRSIVTINLHEQLERVADLFEHFGGHEFACGFTLRSANLEALRSRLAAAFDALDDALFVRKASVDAIVRFAEIDRGFFEGHEMLQPFGAANLQPLFMTAGVRVKSRRMFSADCWELQLEDGSATTRAVLWPSAIGLLAELEGEGSRDILYTLDHDARSPGGMRLTIADVRPAA